MIYIQRPFEDPEVSAAQYATKIDEVIELQNNAMEFHRSLDFCACITILIFSMLRVPHRITKGNVYVKDSSLYYEVYNNIIQIICISSVFRRKIDVARLWVMCVASLFMLFRFLDQCRDWANEYGRVEGAWDMWMCSVPSTWHPDCGGLAWQPGDVAFMGEFSWYAGRCGDNGILHEMYFTFIV